MDSSSTAPEWSRPGAAGASDVLPEAGAESASVGAVVEARGLKKRFGQLEALRGVSLFAHRGELVAVIGPNGAGKTTLLTILAGIQAADEGELSLPRAGVGWVPQQAALYRRLTVEENLRLFARLERVADHESTVERMISQAGLADRRGEQVGRLSSGNQQRINIAIGLLSEPAVLLLDEPSAGLDPRQRQRLWEFVLDLAGGGTTVLFATHDLAEAERYGERILVLADGEALFDGSAAELHRAVKGLQDSSKKPTTQARPAVATNVTADEPRSTSDFELAFVAFLGQRGH